MARRQPTGRCASTAKKIKVASYGANSGATPDAGATAELVLYREGMPAEALRGKIAVIVKPGPETLPPMTGDYEYLSNADTFADPAAPASELLAVNPFRLMGLTTAQAPLIAAGAVGAIIVMPFSYDIVAGLYTFGVPEIHQMPTLYLDREAGASVIDAATAGKRATLRLVATTEQADTHQLFCYLPGKDYGTPNDSQVLLVTHTDGPSISQENGALGILSMVRYFSRVPQAERPRTLMVFLDCRHYMPGAETGICATGLCGHSSRSLQTRHRVDGDRTSRSDQGGGEKGPAVPQNQSGRTVIACGRPTTRS